MSSSSSGGPQSCSISGAPDPDDNTGPPISGSTVESTRQRKRKKLGRSSRQKRKKWLEIQKTAAQALSGDSPSMTTKTSLIPQDRNYVWPSVQGKCQLADDDRQALLGQLGYVPGNALKVVARWGDVWNPSELSNLSAQDKASATRINGQEPLVLELYPLALRQASDGRKKRRKRGQIKGEKETLPYPHLKKKQTSASKPSDQATSPNHKEESDKAMPIVAEPFPTYLWCVHPIAKALISQLELEHFVKRYEKVLQTDTTALESMTKAHRLYGQDRSALLTSDDWKWIEQRKWQPAFDAKLRGVAGIPNFGKVKCLHAHAAHYWSGCRDNVVGKWVVQEIQRKVLKSSEQQQHQT